MRVLNVEDYPIKHQEIKTALNRLGITDIILGILICGKNSES